MAVSRRITCKSCGAEATRRINFGDGSVGAYCTEDAENIKRDARAQGWLEEIEVEDLGEADHQNRLTFLGILGSAVGEGHRMGFSPNELGDFMETAAHYLQDKDATWEEAVDTTFGAEEANDG